MSRILQKRLQLQLFFALAAACLVAVLLIEVVADAVHHAQGYVISETNRSLSQAIRELRREYDLRTAGDTAWRSLPIAARNLSLRALSDTVLSAYPGVEGGYWNRSQFLGYSFPTHDGGSPKYDVPAAEENDIAAVIQQALPRGHAQRVLRGKRDFVVIAASGFGERAVWAMKRLPGQATAAEREHSLLLAVLVGAAFLSAAGVLATGFALRRGVSQITAGLSRLNTDLAHKLPERRDELGEISAAINKMASTRRRLEAELQREDRLRTIGRLVGRIAHEMRNPLNGIRLSLQVLARRAPQGDPRKEDFQGIIEEVDRMNRLLSDLLVFQQPRPAHIHTAAMASVVEKSVQIVRPEAETRQVRLSISTDGNGTAAAAMDEQYCIQVIVNLLLNAIEVSPVGSAILVGLRESASGVEISVTDSGPGLNADQREHLFEPFYTTKVNGHGLGLAVSRELMRSMHGDLLYESTANGGARFIMKLQGAPDGV